MTTKQPLPDIQNRLDAIKAMRLRFREATVHELRAATMRRSSVDVADGIARIPMEAAAAGFDVQIVQHKNGWHLRISRRIDSETEFYASAQAKSLHAALVQLIERGLAMLDQLDTAARREIRKRDAQISTVAANAAA